MTSGNFINEQDRNGVPVLTNQEITGSGRPVITALDSNNNQVSCWRGRYNIMGQHYWL